MTTARLTKRRTRLEAHAEQVIAAIVEGQKAGAIAERLKCSPEAVYHFMSRHEEEIAEARSQVMASLIKNVEDYAIASKVNRIATLDTLKSKLEEEIDTNGAIDVDRQGVRSAPLVKELRATVHDAALQLGQLPRPEVNVQANIVLVREVTRGEGEHPALG